MKRILLLCLIAITFRITGYSQTLPGENCKIDWETSFEAAKVRAQSEGKPILLMHLFGRLDEEMA